MEYSSDDCYDLCWNGAPSLASEHNLIQRVVEVFDPIIDDHKKLSEKWPQPKRRSRLHRTLSLIYLNAVDAFVIGKCLVIDRSTRPTDGSWPDDALTDALQLLVTRGQLDLADGPEASMAVTVATESELGGLAARCKAEALDHSQPLDVHKWSEHPEVNDFINQIYGEHFGSGNAGIRKKHIKVVLLDLYVRWTVDPLLKTGVALNPNRYDAGSRYNALHISKLTIPVVKRLEEVGLIYLVKGFRSPTNPKDSRDARIWPTPSLAKLFAEVRFGVSDVTVAADKEVIVLRNSAKKDIDYEDTAETNGMRHRLRHYNELIARTFVDIPTLAEPYLTLTDGKKLHINQRDKFTRRIFSRGDFSKGGRFYGGWWQRCPEELRMGIFINDSATVELDYSNLHPMLLYARTGEDYDQNLGDVYTVEVPELDLDLDTRAIAKSLLLIALNAKNEKATFHAFRREAAPGSREKGLSNGTLRCVLAALRQRLAPVAEYIATDAGIDLMNLDAKITDRILTALTDKAIPVLSIHDSYIVRLEHEHELELTMQAAFSEVTGKPHFKIVPSRRLHPENTLPFAYQLTAGKLHQHKIDIRSAFPWAFPERTERYVREMCIFRDLRGIEQAYNSSEHRPQKAAGREAASSLLTSSVRLIPKALGCDSLGRVLRASRSSPK